jgi:futalosine hydrolase
MAGKSEIRGMNITLVAATRMEIEPTLHYLSERIYLRRHQHIDTLITGVGMVSTTYQLARQFLTNKPTLAIQAGIAGSFHPIYAPGMVVSVREELMGDLGVSETDGWKDLFDLGFVAQNDTPWQNKKLTNPHQELLRKTALECVRGLTVNQISTNRDMINTIRDKYMPVVEKIPFLQLRGISNYVGERNKANWKIRESIDALNQQLIKMINQITEPYT